MARKQHYMTYAERIRLEEKLEHGDSVARIAEEMGFSKQTIYNEMKRGAYSRTVERHGYYREETHYSADKAQQIHDYNQTAKGRPLKIGHDYAYAEYLERKIIQDRYSPAAALAAARSAGHQTQICVTTLYNYIDKGIFYHLDNRALWEKSKRKKRSQRPESRVVHKKLPSIEQRPQKINDRTEKGHWEMDLVVGIKESKAVLLTLTERVSRYEIILKLPDRRAATIRAAFDDLEKKTPKFKQKFKSITTDNGAEFLEYNLLRRSIRGGTRFEVYYCHSYAAWEKGSNENHNRMIRRFFPKGTDFSKITKEQIAQIQNWMNRYPRKILDWRTPEELIA